MADADIMRHERYAAITPRAAIRASDAARAPSAERDADAMPIEMPRRRADAERAAITPFIYAPLYAERQRAERIMSAMMTLTPMTSAPRGESEPPRRADITPSAEMSRRQSDTRRAPMPSADAPPPAPMSAERRHAAA